MYLDVMIALELASQEAASWFRHTQQRAEAEMGGKLAKI